MKTYKALVKRLADLKSSELIPNGGVEHAEVLIENVFTHAQSIVRVFTGELNARVYGSPNIISAAKEYLQSGSGKQLHVLIQDAEVATSGTLDKHDLVKMCKDVGGNNCEFRTVGRQDDADMTSHFVVMDELAYRFEPDRQKPTAIGCFNDPENAKILVHAFDVMFERGNKIAMADYESSVA